MSTRDPLPAATNSARASASSPESIADRPLNLRTEAQVSGYATTIDLPRVRLVVIEGPDQGGASSSLFRRFQRSREQRSQPHDN